MLETQNYKQPDSPSMGRWLQQLWKHILCTDYIISRLLGVACGSSKE